MTIGDNSTPGTTFDQIVITGGTFTVGGATLQLTAFPSTKLNVPYPIIVAPGGTIDSSTAFSNLTNGTTYSADISYQVTYPSSEIDVTFTVVPEPFALAPAACLLGLLRRRRRAA